MLGWRSDFLTVILSMKKPNLFDYATKELSQDAFLVWYIKWADNACLPCNENLHQSANRFVSKLLSLKGHNVEVVNVDAGRQWENIDIWVEVNKTHLIIIEDKVNTGAHSGQLERYSVSAMEYCEEHNLTPVCIYLKTGSESKYTLTDVEAAGFTVLDRAALLESLALVPVNNDIFQDFFERLQRIQESESGFVNKLIGLWDWDDWKGFYQELETLSIVSKWDYVPNPSGGFLNAVIEGLHEMEDCILYMQIEQGSVCFKIGEVYENRSEIRNKYHEMILNTFTSHPEVTRPQRFGNGCYMTVAVVDSEQWLGSKEETVDVKAVFERLLSYQEKLKKLVEQEK